MIFLLLTPHKIIQKSNHIGVLSKHFLNSIRTGAQFSGETVSNDKEIFLVNVLT